ncbi:MAG: class I adenylate-forming enzyme family protein, partial [Pseudomonadota bacterium]
PLTPTRHWSVEQPQDQRHEVHFGRTVRCFAERPASVHGMFMETAGAHGHRHALVGEEGVLSYDALFERVSRVAGGLRAAGLQPGERVVLLMGNRFAFVEVFLATACAGLICVPLNPRQRAQEIAFAVGQCAASAIIFDADLSENIPEPGDIPTVRLTWSAYGDVADANRYETLGEADPLDADPASEDACAAILYTSGTTGRPKGAMLTNLNIVHSSLHFALSMDFGPGDRMLLAVPASHVTGLIANITTALIKGGAIVFLRAFKAVDCLALMARERVTHTVIVPAMYNLFLLEETFSEHNLTAWRVGGYGGAPMPQATIEEMARRAPHVGLMNGYGATEACSPITMNPPRFAASHSDCVGLVLHCCDVLVMDADGREAAPGEQGEIWMYGPNIIPGYWDNDQANRDNFVGGFWKSGDIGSKDADGFVRIFDRIKDMLNRGGYKIFSIEVENQISFHPNVMEMAIIGSPCPVLGERVHAVIVPKDAEASEDLSEDIRRFAAERLSNYKVPERIIFRETPLPRNANGKIIKTALRQEYAS